MTTLTQDLSQALVVSDSQFAPSFVEDSQPMSEMAPDSEVFASDSLYVPVVLVEPTPAAAAAATAAAIKLAAAKAKKDGRSNNMKWQSFMSTFVLNKMCELTSSGVRTDKGFKEVHLNTVAKQVFEFCGQMVSATQVYNHLRKWRSPWIQVSKLRDLSGASWNENTCSIVLEAEHYAGHVADHPRNAEFLNTPIQNYSQMQHIFSFGLATGKHAMGSGEPLGSPMPDFLGTPEVEVLDGPDKPVVKPFDKPFDPVHDRKRKRGGLMEEEINVFCSMTEAVKEVATTIRECKPLDVHPDMYVTVMTQGGFSDEALMAALSHLLDNNAQGVGFVSMADGRRVLWLRSWLGKHYY
ncbi:hypothetical protein VPH35_034163 [Triticum aestivum]